jgi:hypothetical protein
MKDTLLALGIEEIPLACFQQTKLDERILFRLQDATKVELAS